MMTMMKRFSIAAAASCLLAAALLLSGCAEVLNPSAGQAAGTGTVRVLINGGNAAAARTVFPDFTGDLGATTALYYKYWFAKNGGAAAEKTPDAGSQFILEVGTYTLTVEAYTDAGKTAKVGTGDGTVGGNTSFAITAGPNATPITVTLEPWSATTTGTFTYTITYPAGATLDTLTWAPAATPAVTVDLLITDTAVEHISVTTTSGSTAGAKTLAAPGNYVVRALLTDSAGKIAGKEEVVRIYGGLNTVIDAGISGKEYGFAFTAGDFIEPLYKLVDPTNQNIKTKFGASTATEAFAKLHYLISSPIGTDDFTTIIALGDYIDLDSLPISGSVAINDVALDANRRLLRLIVVGINSFSTGAAAANNPGAPGHVVFQFQNIPVTHRMEATDINTNGYLGSEMRTYLTGAFLTGLKAVTGLTDAMLWGPTRKVANKGSGADGTHTITDTLWLPTEWEMFGSNTYSSTTHETSTNQARLEYYDSPARRIKYISGLTATEYWLASPNPSNTVAFDVVNNSGAAYVNVASAVGGCAPAFCVK
jgi:hypothetical protein